MKKKLRLLTTIASISLALGMMVFGILAATNVTVGVSSTVTYTAEGIAFKLYGTVELLADKPTGTPASVSGSEANLLANVNIQSTGTETATLEDKEYTEELRWVVMTFTVKNVGSNVIGTINVVPTAADTNVEATTDSESITANLFYNQETTFRVYYYLKNVNMSIFNGTTNTAITMLQEGVTPSLPTDQSFIAPNSLDGFEAVVNGSTTTYTKGDEKFEVKTSTSGTTVNETNTYTNGEKVTTFTTTYDSSTVQASAQNTPAMTFGAQALSAEYVVADRTLKSVYIRGGDASKVEIPDWMNIVAIVNGSNKNGCFYKFRDLIQEVVLPSTLTSIGDYAFQWCRLLTSIKIPEKMTRIGNYAFDSCYALAEVYNLSSLNIVAGEVTNANGYVTVNAKIVHTSASEPTRIVKTADLAYYVYDGEKIALAPLNKAEVTSITFDSDTTSINKFAFYGCGALTSIEIPAGVTNIMTNTFADCCSLTSITIPEGVTNIEYLAFGSCYALAEVYNFSGLNITAGASNNGSVAQHAKVVHASADEPTRIVKTADMAYYVYNGEKIALTPLNRAGVTSIILDSDTTEIKQHAFYECSFLTSVEIPSGITNIGDYVFYKCSTLKLINIPSGVTMIGKYAFYYCELLTSINIPSSVISIERYAFENCSKLKTVTIDSSTVASGLTNKTASEFLINYATTVKIKSGLTVGSYVTTNYTNVTTEVIEGVTYNVYSK